MAQVPLRTLLKPSLNWLLVFVAVAPLLQVTHASGSLVFLASCLAIVPLAGWLGKATEHIAEIIALMQSKIDFIRTKLPQAFRTLVRGNLEIRRLPPAEEAGAPGAYGGAGSIDGSIPALPAARFPPNVTWPAE